MRFRTPASLTDSTTPLSYMESFFTEMDIAIDSSFAEPATFANPKCSCSCGCNRVVTRTDCVFCNHCIENHLSDCLGAMCQTLENRTEALETDLNSFQEDIEDFTASLKIMDDSSLSGPNTFANPKCSCSCGCNRVVTRTDCVFCNYYIAKHLAKNLTLEEFAESFGASLNIVDDVEHPGARTSTP